MRCCLIDDRFVLDDPNMHRFGSCKFVTELNVTETRRAFVDGFWVWSCRSGVIRASCEDTCGSCKPREEHTAVHVQPMQFAIKCFLWPEMRVAGFDCAAVGRITSRVLRRWAECNHEQYFREVTVKKRARRDGSQDFAWAEHYTASLTMENCLLAEEIAAQFDRFGGGILTSATLAPPDIYQRTIGLDQVVEEGRPVKEIGAGLPFPAENRESCAVDIENFTYANRGPSNPRSRDDDQDELREQYAGMIRDAARTTMRSRLSS